MAKWPSQVNFFFSFFAKINQIEGITFYSLIHMEYEETWPRTPLREPNLSPKIQNIIQVKILDSGEIKNVNINNR